MFDGPYTYGIYKKCGTKVRKAQKTFQDSNLFPNISIGHSVGFTPELSP